MNDESEYQSLILDAINHIGSDKFWKDEIKSKLNEKFPKCLSLFEESPTYDLRKSVMMEFQFFQSFSYWTGVKFTSRFLVQMIENSHNIQINDTDISVLNFLPFDEFSKKFQDSKRSPGIFLYETSIIADTLDVLKSSAEYVMTLQSLTSAYKKPRDLYRECEKSLPGFTVDKSRNSKVSQAR